MGDAKAFPRKKHGRMWKGAHNVTAGKGGAKRPFISAHENQGGGYPRRKIEQAAFHVGENVHLPRVGLAPISIREFRSRNSFGRIAR